MSQAAMHAAPPEPFDFEADEKYFQQHHEANFAHAGGDFHVYAPAYHLGASLAQVHHDMPWEGVEAEAQERWEATFDEPWRTFQDAVKYGYERGRMHDVQAKVRSG